MRIRRPAAETRDELLSVAERLVAAHGPHGLNLDDVAAHVHVTRQAVLHHFGNRAELMRAVAERAWRNLFAELAAIVADPELSPAELVDRVDDIARRRGNARLGAWLLLSGEGLPDQLFAGALAPLPGLLRKRGANTADATFALLLLGASLFGDAVFGERLRQALGLPDSEEERRRFRRWLVDRFAAPATAAPPRTIVYVRDQAAACRFYRDVLQVEPVLDVPGMTELPLPGGALLGLMPEAGIRRLLGIDPVDGPRTELYLTVGDPAAYHARAVAAGAKELAPLQPRDWGDVAAYSLDADGVVLGFARPA